MLLAASEEGGRAREMMLDVKDAVEDYMKVKIEERMSQLAIAEQEKTTLATTVYLLGRTTG